MTDSPSVGNILNNVDLKTTKNIICSICNYQSGYLCMEIALVQLLIKGLNIHICLGKGGSII